MQCAYVSCAHICMCLGIHANAVICKDPVLTSSVFLDYSPPYRLRQGLCLHLEIAVLATWLASQLALGIPCLLIPTQCSYRWATKPTWIFMWVLRLSVIVLSWQVLFPLNHIHSPYFYILFIYWLIDCVCSCVRIHVCMCYDAHVRQQLWSWLVLSFYLFVVLVIELRSSSLCGIYLYLLRHLTAPFCPLF